MTSRDDLTPITASDETEVALAIGWLSAKQDVVTGPTPAGLIEAWERALDSPVSKTRSWYQCPFCGGFGMGPTTYLTTDGSERLLGHATLELRGMSGRAWRSPDLVLHYVDQHDYRPPDEFVHDIVDGEPAPG